MENISGTYQKPQGRYHGYRHKTPSPTQSPAISRTLHVTLLWRVSLDSVQMFTKLAFQLDDGVQTSVTTGLQ